MVRCELTCEPQKTNAWAVGLASGLIEGAPAADRRDGAGVADEVRAVPRSSDPSAPVAILTLNYEPPRCASSSRSLSLIATYRLWLSLKDLSNVSASVVQWPMLAA